jgi:cation diffusion facilitator CzcD-associated flavoprotein CzcO
MRVAIVGCGVSGIAAAKVLKRLGHEVVLFERSSEIGGVWAVAYPNVRLQNIGDHYRFTDFDWPFKHDEHPSAAEVMKYLRAAVEHFGLDVRLAHNVTGLSETADGWTVEVATPQGTRAEAFDWVVAASGHYTGEKTEMALPGRDKFRGIVMTERDLRDAAVFDGKRVAVVGLGKSAIDMATFAKGRARQVHQVFRAARWLMPRRLLGKHIAYVSTSRLSTMFEPAWVYPTRLVRFLHKWSPLGVRINSKITDWLVRREEGFTRRHVDRDAAARMALLNPQYPVSAQLRGTLAPDGFFAAIADGSITPHLASATGFTEEALLLDDGTSIAADIVILAIGFKTPDLPFLPPDIRAAMAENPDGTQLYRHVLHPRLKRFGFAGFNHNPFHIPGVEVGMTWLGAVMAGDIVLPSPDEMEASTHRVRDWKRKHTIFEPTRAYWVSNRFHNYLDTLLMELGVRPWRKRNPFAEIFAAYEPADYAGIVEEYERARGKPRRTLPLDT